MSYLPGRWVVTENPIDTAADVFPGLKLLPGREIDADKQAEFRTHISETESGREEPVSLWSSPRWTFTLNYEFLRHRVSQAELSRLWAFFCTALGRFNYWFYQDPYDNGVTGATLGVGDGTTRDFQATRTHGAGTGYAFNEAVRAFWLTPIVYVNGVSTASFTVQPWGVIRFNSAPAAGANLTWTGSFLHVCRFEDDTLNVKQMFKDLFSAKGITFRSQKP